MNSFEVQLDVLHFQLRTLKSLLSCDTILDKKNLKARKLICENFKSEL